MNHSVIAAIIALFGILIGLACVIGFYSPIRIIEWVISLWKRKFVFCIAVGIRLVFGVLFIIAAPETRSPLFFQFFGYLMIAAALLLSVLGRGRISRLLDSLKHLPPILFRLWLCAGIIFGIFIVYGVIG